MHVRLALLEDKPDLLALAGLQVAELFPHLEYDPAIAAEKFEQDFGRGDQLLTVCETEGGDVIGYLLAAMYGYRFCSGVFVEQQVLYVRPDKRGSRAAALLVRNFVEWGETVGAREMLLGVSTGQHIERTTRFLQRVTGSELVGSHLRLVKGAHNG